MKLRAGRHELGAMPACMEAIDCDVLPLFTDDPTMLAIRDVIMLQGHLSSDHPASWGVRHRYHHRTKMAMSRQA